MCSKEFDVLVIGSGAAGASLALHLCEDSNIKIAILSKNKMEDGATINAQGGIAAVMDENDSIESHVKDTLDAGAGLCDPKTVLFTVKNGKKSIQWLIDQGIKFTKDKDSYHLTKEGGHSKRRIMHADDATGREVENTLINLVKNTKNIFTFENHIAIDLVVNKNTCIGAYVYDEALDKVIAFNSKVTVLACGGASRTYLYSTNPNVASGDGIAMGKRAGCKISNMEFNQFHPTCLYHPKAGSFLISEAMRGEGAHLILPNGERFMDKFDKRAELAPRDIVARAIDHEMKRLGIRNVYLDISYKSEDFIKSRFPNIYRECLKYGFDITKEPIPIVPASHYTCGGIKVDLNGCTNIRGLYAIGETSCTGLHGANRLASNSLLECFVFAEAAASHICANIDNFEHKKKIKKWI